MKKTVGVVKGYATGSFTLEVAAGQVFQLLLVVRANRTLDNVMAMTPDGD